jgi:hypothetical protein
MTYPTEKAQLELISTARQFLNSEYAKRCTEEYRVWSSTNQNNINRVGEVLLRYPPFSGALSPLSFRSTIARPTEDDVVKKALELYNRARPSPYQNSVPAVVDPFSSLTDHALATTPAPAVEIAGSTPSQSFAVSTQVAPAPLAVESETQSAPAIESVATVDAVASVAVPATPEPVSEPSFTDRIMDIFKKPSEISTPSVTAAPEPDPLLEPVVVTESTDTRTDYTVEVPAVEIPEPVAAPQLTIEHSDKIQAIFKDVPKPTGITGLIRRAFSKKDTTTKDAA